MTNQLKRTYKGINYYCVLISKEHWKCLERKKIVKEHGGKARIIQVSGGWGVFCA